MSNRQKERQVKRDKQLKQSIELSKLREDIAELKLHNSDLLFSLRVVNKFQATFHKLEDACLQSIINAKVQLVLYKLSDLRKEAMLEKLAHMKRFHG